ncbi:uncharacterized protein VP01_1012g3 [Puccinia sorghi]|uniref:Chromatin modification-related protein EAF7 n=1 Tax=Puccinia sorghi TaxID=27349 RepID=A0A0L6VWC8_9BASI|nr:uncharacterized protein VP01_1012g3 [Puccinia sorghi]
MGSPLTETDGNNILSTTDGETAFFRSIIRYRPRGPNRHFSMVGICRDLERELHAVVPSRLIWNALRSCYDLDILAEMEPDEADEIDGSKSTEELLRSKQETFFREFQLPIDPSVPPEQSFQRLVDDRRLASSSDGSSPEQRPRSLPPTSPRRRTTSNSLKLHILDRPSSSKPKSAPDLNFLQEGMESDLTEQEDYDDDDDNDDDLKDLQTKQDEHEDDDDEHERAPESRSKKQRTSTSNAKSAVDIHAQQATPASRSRNTGNSNKSATAAASTSRSRTRARSKRCSGLSST